MRKLRAQQFTMFSSRHESRNAYVGQAARFMVGLPHADHIFTWSIRDQVMTYLFNGFFAEADESLLQSALTRWPYCTGRVIDHPAKYFELSGVHTQKNSFVGLGVRWPDPVDIFEDPKRG